VVLPDGERGAGARVHHPRDRPSLFPWSAATAIAGSECEIERKNESEDESEDGDEDGTRATRAFGG